MPAVPGRPESNALDDDDGQHPAVLSTNGLHSATHSPEAEERSTDQKAVSWQRIVRFPVTRIVIFGLCLLCFYAILAVVIERFDRFDYQYWSAPLAAIAALAVMGRFDHISLAGFGFSKPRSALRELAIGCAVGGATMSAIVGLMATQGWYHGRIMPLTAPVMSSLGNTFAIFFSLAVFEEAVYRGYFFQTLERRWGADIAFAATMVTFGLMHLTVDVPHASISLKLIGALSIAVEAGILFAAAYLLTRRLWMPIGLHWAWNFFEGPVFGTPVTGNNIGQTIFAGHVSGPAWATGGGFGPEASIPALIVGTALGLLLLWVAHRRKHHR
jgi:hypothetical protein